MNAAAKSPPAAAKPKESFATSSAAGGSGAQLANQQQSLVGNQSVMRSLGISNPKSTPERSSTAAAGGPLGLPIYWGWDTTKEPRLYYVTISPPGRKLAEVAAFLYATEGAAAE